MNRRLLVALFMLAALVFAGPAVVTAQDATPAAGTAFTDVRYVLPFTPDGLNPSLTATSTEEGACGFSSVAALDRPDAWECVGESNQIYDPCFENPFLPPDEPGQVACFDSPFTTDVVVFTLTQPLEREKEVADATMDMTSDPTTAIDPLDLPWALELANGDRCTLLHGTLEVIAGQVAHYGCENGGLILGETDHAQPLWWVTYLAEGDVASSRVAVLTAWS